ncbi:hypothetical protein HSB1_46320 [Halogranum salarium B-1]|uniref:Uncharacterized protein n=1 Tax=Halogranum salarium B-1 TaxID=1210908 RepID=J3JD77_9EURY|nr:hypothetical protein HSB1_46320 [Halogranum salarium B-1]
MQTREVIEAVRDAETVQTGRVSRRFDSREETPESGREPVRSRRGETEIHAR